MPSLLVPPLLTGCGLLLTLGCVNAERGGGGCCKHCTPEQNNNASRGLGDKADLFGLGKNEQDVIHRVVTPEYC
ncbi:hypothetical protein E2C01_015328 [Portunus trituberculatus]|uniref:Uncharacterized protein n=1 Tax=Portunus trituberculatus TaxID=210409 RepID=A0A5B7DMF5_PORTR|nr:hypothetical protein [Portunus trituberculatus]